MEAPNLDALRAAFGRKLLHLSRDLEKLARAGRTAIPREELGQVWAAQMLISHASESLEPREDPRVPYGVPRGGI